MYKILLEPSGYFIYHQVQNTKTSTFHPQSVFMCFAWISEQTAIVSLYSFIDWFYTRDGVCLLRGTDWIFKRNSG